jgi:ABC-type enterochelin transport system ATPase subunit
VLHDINMAARYCDHLVALRQGALIAEGGPETMMQAISSAEVGSSSNRQRLFCATIIASQAR